MSSVNPVTIAPRPTGSRRFARAALLVGSLVLGASAFGHNAVSNAEPEWDIAQYDNCLKSYPYDPLEDPNRWYDHVEWCCHISGGVWQGSTRYGDCVAPPALRIQGVPLGPKLGQTDPQTGLPPVTAIGPAA